MAMGCTDSFATPPLLYTEAPYIFSQSPPEFRSLLLGQHAVPTRIAFFGDSTSWDQLGAGGAHMNWRRWLWHQYHGHTPATQLCRTSNFGNVPGGEFMLTGAALNGFPGAAPETALPPGFGGPASTTFARDGFGAAGMHIQLNHSNHNHVSQSCSWGPNGFYYVAPAVNQGMANFAAGTMAGGKSLIDAAAGLRVEVLAATHPNSAAEVWWGVIPQVDHCTPNSFATLTQSGAIFGGGQSLTGPVGGYRRSQTPLLQNLVGLEHYYRVIVSGNTTDPSHAVQIVGARYVSDNPTGLITDSFSQGGYTSVSVLAEHPEFGAALAAGGYTCAWLMYGVNDEFSNFSPQFFKDQNLALISFIRSAVGNPALPIVLETSAMTNFSTAAGKQYAGVLYEIAQSDAHVMFVNSRRVAEEQYGWGTGLQWMYLSDGVHHTNLGAQVLSQSSIETVIEYLENAPVPCDADVDASGTVNIADLLAVIGAWGSNRGPADVNHDGIVNIADLLAVIAAWGPCR
jgi:lysophospholipase L1-like esterase